MKACSLAAAPLKSNQHPLKPIMENIKSPSSSKVSSTTTTSSKKKESSRLAEDTLDPLSLLVAQQSLLKDNDDDADDRNSDERANGVDAGRKQQQQQQQHPFDRKSWAAKRSAILARYTTNEKLSIASSFLTPFVPLGNYYLVEYSCVFNFLL